MPFPTPSNTGQSYTDPNTGRSWVVLQLTGPTVWGVDKSKTVSFGGGISASGGMTLTGGMSVYGPVVITGNTIIDGDLNVLGNIPYSYISVNLTGPYRTESWGGAARPDGGVELQNYYAPLSVSGPLFVKGGTGTTNGISYMLGHFVFDSQVASNNDPWGQTAAEFYGNVKFSVGNNPNSIVFYLPNTGGTTETNSMKITNPFTTWGMDVQVNGIRFDEAESFYYNGIGVRSYFAPPGTLKLATLPASGITAGAFALGVSRVPQGGGLYGATGFGFLHLLHGGTGAGTTAAPAIRVIRGNNTQAFINYAGEFYGLGVRLTSDTNKKTNLAEYNESFQPFGKWMPAIRNNFNPYSFTYIDAPELGTKFGYLAQDLSQVDEKLAAPIFVASEGNTADSATVTGSTNYYISQDQLLFGAIEAIRELDAEVCRLWKLPSTPPPSRAKDNDLWFNSETSKMYMRLNDGTKSHWIQVN
jgi:hypothetical protein